MTDSAINVEHDLRILDDHLERLRGHLRELADAKQFDTLQLVWKRPGWTTPAEFFLVRAALEALVGQAQAMQKSLEGLAEGAERVRSEG